MNKYLLPILLSIIFVATLFFGFFVLNKENTTIEKPKAETNNFNNNQVEKAIINYLLTQKQFSWQTTDNSANHCAIKNLESNNEFFPLSIWVYCIEYKFEDNKLVTLSGTSMPVKIFYPNELSFYDLNKFTHEAPRDGSYNGPDIEKIFSAETRKNMRDQDLLINKAQKEILLNQENWMKIIKAAKECQIKKTFQNHSREVNVVLKSGEEISALEPKIDDIFEVIGETECKNRVEMATE